MQQNSGNQTSAALKVVSLTVDDNIQPMKKAATKNQVNYQFGLQGRQPVMDLMNSTEWGTLLPTQTFSFEWKPNAEDLVWRHGLQPNDQYTHPANQQCYTSAYGRWDGDLNIGNTSDWEATNTLLRNKLLRNPTKPMPAALIRPATFHDPDKNLLPLVFQCLVKYHSTIEMDINDIGNHPIFSVDIPESTTSGSLQRSYAYDVFGPGPTTQTGFRAYQQWSGCNIAGNFVTGPSSGGHSV